jgi:undecaprenyl-diphosphatase
MAHLMSLDLAIFRGINAISNPFLDSLMYAVSLVGEQAAILWIICVIMLFLDKMNGRTSLLLTFVAVVLSNKVIGEIVKHLWYRPRPFMYLEGIKVLGHKWNNGSFPSGHADSLFAGSVILGFFYPRMRWPLYIFCIVTCFSRVYCGMHHPLDVIAGAAIGLGTGWGVLAVYKRWSAKKTAPTCARGPHTVDRGQEPGIKKMVTGF